MAAAAIQAFYLLVLAGSFESSIVCPPSQTIQLWESARLIVLTLSLNSDLINTAVPGRVGNRLLASRSTSRLLLASTRVVYKLVLVFMDWIRPDPLLMNYYNYYY